MGAAGHPNIQDSSGRQGVSEVGFRKSQNGFLAKLGGFKFQATQKPSLEGRQNLFTC